MTLATHDVRLVGCRPQPLAGWLKALAVLRLVAEQADAKAQGWWCDDEFVLRSRLDREGLIRFFLEEWRPTPVITPWNGGSGFFAKDNTSGIDAITANDDRRFDPYREAVEVARRVLDDLNLTVKPDKATKSVLLSRLRSEIPDAALAWFDAAVALTGDEPSFPPLLGTGGNDGRLDFANNQMQRLAELLLSASTAESLLCAALFGEVSRGLRNTAVGQFAPASAGGANAGQGFGANARVDPWDYVLMVEGSLLLTAACTRRLESRAPGSLSFPFMVRTSGVGYTSAAATDEADSRDEIWLPLWGAPAGLAEVRALFGEGRAKVGRRTASTGVDFARAIASLGVDRGVDAFERYGFQVRNGLAYFAVPIGRWQVTHQPDVDLISDIDTWHTRLRRAAASGPAALGREARGLDDAILELCRKGGAERLQRVLVALGRVEAIIARSPSLRDKLRPIPRLSRAWVGRTDDGSAEFRLALALSGARRRISPVDIRTGRWVAQPDAATTWLSDDLVRNLLASNARAEMEAGRDQCLEMNSRSGAALGDLADFIEGRVDDRRIAELARGLSAIEPLPLHCWGSRRPMPPVVFAMLAVAWHRPRIDAEPLPRTAGLAARAAAGDGLGATTLAWRRLHGAGLQLAVQPFDAPAPVVRRAAAALAFNLAPTELNNLRRLLARPTPED